LPGEGFSGIYRSSSGMGKIRYQIQNKTVVNARNCTCALVLIATSGLTSELFASDSSQEQLSNNDPVISKLMPERAHGRGFKLEYFVDAPLDVFWNFKTNFDNEFLHKNRYINSHKLVSREDNLVITETEYSYKPREVFKWQTTVFPARHLLEYTLMNPEECGQNYHYGYVQLEADGTRTRVTHVSYFDFFGVSLWVNYPFKGGMAQFLKYTARWEQQLVSEIEHRYQQ
jgi:hypothetical protein